MLQFWFMLTLQVLRISFTLSIYHHSLPVVHLYKSLTVGWALTVFTSKSKYIDLWGIWYHAQSIKTIGMDNKCDANFSRLKPVLGNIWPLATSQPNNGALAQCSAFSVDFSKWVHVNWSHCLPTPCHRCRCRGVVWVQATYVYLLPYPRLLKPQYLY